MTNEYQNRAEENYRKSSRYSLIAGGVFSLGLATTSYLDGTIGNCQLITCTDDLIGAGLIGLLTWVPASVTFGGLAQLFQNNPNRDN